MLWIGGTFWYKLSQKEINRRTKELLRTMRTYVPEDDYYSEKSIQKRIESLYKPILYLSL